MRVLKRLMIRIILVALAIALFVVTKNIVSNLRELYRFRYPFSPSLDLPKAGYRNIFFLETSCSVNYESPEDNTYGSGLVLPPSVACAVESAALANPNRPVFFVHTCPLDLEDLMSGEVADFARALFSLPNVFLWPVRYSPLFFGTPLEKLIEKAFLQESMYPTIHASYLLRYLLLWKYGGTYLDSDVLVLNSFEDLHDFSYAVSPSQISASVLDFSMERPGRLLAEACVKESLHVQWKSDISNGHSIVTRAMQTVCGGKNVSEMSAETCHGFHLLPTSDMHAIPVTERRRLFDNFNTDKTQEIHNSFGVRIWDNQSKEVAVKTNSRKIYSQIAQSRCPSVISTLYDPL